jgi:hypothetical protein
VALLPWLRQQQYLPLLPLLLLVLLAPAGRHWPCALLPLLLLP